MYYIVVREEEAGNATTVIAADVSGT
jgi:hypothetical protein